jgi:hypothetical protein
MKLSNYLALFALMVVISVLTSTFVARYFAQQVVDQQQRIVVLDLAELARSIDPKDPQGQEKLKDLINKTRTVAREYWAQGYVVLNETAILEAPDDVFIQVD